MKGMVFKSSLLWDRGHRLRVWVLPGIGYHFPKKMINWLKIIIETRETENCHSKIKSVLFCLDCDQRPQKFLETAALLYDSGGGGGGW